MHLLNTFHATWVKKLIKILNECMSHKTVCHPEFFLFLKVNIFSNSEHTKGARNFTSY